MKFSKVVFSNPKGVELVFRGSSQSVYQLEAAHGWSLESAEHGVVGTHESRAPLFVPWAQVSHADIMVVAAGKKAS